MAKKDSVFAMYDERFLGKWDFEPNEDIIVTIDRVGKDEVFTQGRKETKTILYFTDSKPIVMNKTNAKLITNLLGTDKWKQWHGHQIALWVDPKVRNPNPGEKPGGIRVRPYPPKEAALICTECGSEIQDAEIGGKTYRAKAIAENARTKFGRILCAECARKAREAVDEAEQ